MNQGGIADRFIYSSLTEIKLSVGDVFVLPSAERIQEAVMVFSPLVS